MDKEKEKERDKKKGKLRKMKEEGYTVYTTKERKGKKVRDARFESS